jgi:hypothetical protein
MLGQLFQPILMQSLSKIVICMGSWFVKSAISSNLWSKLNTQSIGLLWLSSQILFMTLLSNCKMKR